MSDEILFISYSRTDAHLAKELVSALKDAGIRYFVDFQNIRPGSRWAYLIQKALDKSSYVLLINTENSRDSWNVRDEWTYFQGLVKEGVIPLKYDNSQLPFGLHGMHYIDCRSLSPAEIVQEIQELLTYSDDELNLYDEDETHPSKPTVEDDLNISDEAETKDSPVYRDEDEEGDEDDAVAV